MEISNRIKYQSKSNIYLRRVQTVKKPTTMNEKIQQLANYIETEGPKFNIDKQMELNDELNDLIIDSVIDSTKKTDEVTKRTSYQQEIDELVAEMIVEEYYELLKRD